MSRSKINIEHYKKRGLLNVLWRRVIHFYRWLLLSAASRFSSSIKPPAMRCSIHPTMGTLIYSACSFARFRRSWCTLSWQLLFPLSKVLPINSQKFKLFPFHFPRRGSRDRNTSLLMHRNSYSVIVRTSIQENRTRASPAITGLGRDESRVFYALLAEACLPGLAHDEPPVSVQLLSRDTLCAWLGFNETSLFDTPTLQ